MNPEILRAEGGSWFTVIPLDLVRMIGSYLWLVAKISGDRLSVISIDPKLLTEIPMKGRYQMYVDKNRPPDLYSLDPGQLIIWRRMEPIYLFPADPPLREGWTHWTTRTDVFPRRIEFDLADYLGLRSMDQLVIPAILRVSPSPSPPLSPPPSPPSNLFEWLRTLFR